MSDQKTGGLVPLDLTRPNAARVYSYLLGGKDHYPPDREMGDRLMEILPDLRVRAVENRRFLGRAVRFMAEEMGIRQFLDLGSGLPADGNVHEVARQVDPAVRVVYVDHDPVAAAHGKAMLRPGKAAVTAMVCADLRDVGTVLAEARSVLDFSRPVGLTMVAVLHFVADPAPVAAAYLSRLAPGSCVAISHACHEGMDEEQVRRGVEFYRNTPTPLYPRTVAEIEALFAGSEIGRAHV